MAGQDTYVELAGQLPEQWRTSLDDLAREGARHLLRFPDDPAEHCVRLRTTDRIESGFGTVKARTKRTRGAGSGKAGLAMAFKLIQAAEQRWRRVNAPHLVAAVLAGVKFKDGVRVGHGSTDDEELSITTREEAAA
jgi:hypothetical protein